MSFFYKEIVECYKDKEIILQKIKMCGDFLNMTVAKSLVSDIENKKIYQFPIFFEVTDKGREIIENYRKIVLSVNNRLINNYSKDFIDNEKSYGIILNICKIEQCSILIDEIISENNKKIILNNENYKIVDNIKNVTKNILLMSNNQLKYDFFIKMQSKKNLLKGNI